MATHEEEIELMKAQLACAVGEAASSTGMTVEILLSIMKSRGMLFYLAVLLSQLEGAATTLRKQEHNEKATKVQAVVDAIRSVEKLALDADAVLRSY